MSWYNSRKVICRECGYKYVEDISTITITRENCNRCPKCGAEVKVENIPSGNNFLKKLKKSYGDK